MRNLLTLFIFILAVGCNNAQETAIDSKDILIQNVNVIDVNSGAIQNNQDVYIDSGKINLIVDTSADNPPALETIDGTNKYLMPGLAEMHAHIPSTEINDQRLHDVLFLYLSNGITTIRGMLGAPMHLELRDKVESGEILGPRIFTSSPSLNGGSVPTVAEAESKVRSYQKDGYDFLKIHPGIKLEVFDKIVETAKEVGIEFAGHVPVDVGIRHALRSGYASIDHVDGFLEGLVPESANVNPSENGFFGYNFTPLADTSKVDELVALSKRNEVWIVPTQSLFTRWFAPISAEDLLSQPEMKYMPSSTLENWKKVKNDYMSSENFNESQWNDFDAIRKQLIFELHENGQGLLLGSDAPQLFNVPGFSIHHEIKGMKDAGLGNIDIIRTGTINPALFFGMENTFGQVREGLEADLLLLEENPLEDLSELRKLEGVMVRGNWLGKKDIDQRLHQIAGNASKE